jgi:hypothetical protein
VRAGNLRTATAEAVRPSRSEISLIELCPWFDELLVVVAVGRVGQHGLDPPFYQLPKTPPPFFGFCSLPSAHISGQSKYLEFLSSLFLS